MVSDKMMQGVDNILDYKNNEVRFITIESLSPNSQEIVINKKPLHRNTGIKSPFHTLKPWQLCDVIVSYYALVSEHWD